MLKTWQNTHPGGAAQEADCSGLRANLQVFPSMNIHALTLLYTMILPPSYNHAMWIIISFNGWKLTPKKKVRSADLLKQVPCKYKAVRFITGEMGRFTGLTFFLFGLKIKRAEGKMLWFQRKVLLTLKKASLTKQGMLSTQVLCNVNYIRAQISVFFLNQNVYFENLK